MDTLRFIVKRLLYVIPILFLITVFTFLIVHLIPGDPVTVMLGDKGTPETKAALTAKYGLDRSLPYQYYVYVMNLLHLDLGTSLKYNNTVSSLIAAKFPVTLLLTLVSLAFVLLISLPLGYLAGMKKDKLPDQLIKVFSLFGLSTPNFWIGMVLLLVLGVQLRIFPVSGWGDTWPEHMKSLIMPAFTQAVAVSALLVRNLRNSVVDVKNADYIKFAKSKGLSSKKISGRYILRNAMIPTVTLLAIQTAQMLGGSIVIESIFTLPGMGALLVESIFARDYQVIQSVIFIFAFEVMVINILTDVLYSVLNPRVKLN